MEILKNISITAPQKACDDGFMRRINPFIFENGHDFQRRKALADYGEGVL